MLEVYLDPCTINCRKVLAGLDLVGTDYKLHNLNYFNGDQKSADFVKINPMATIPAAVDGDLVITESNAIMQYGADVTGTTTAYPKDLKARAEINTMLLWEASVWFNSCYVYLVEYVVKPLLKAEPDQSKIQAEEANFHKLASVLEKRLEKTDWLCGDKVTLADIAVASPMHLWEASRLPLDQHPKLKRWMTERVEKLPCWQKTQDAVESALLPNKAKN